jgi:hypothetical protein
MASLAVRKIPTPKRFWGFIKSKRCDNTGVAPLKHQTSGITYSDKAKANILNEQFSSVFNKNEDKDNITKKERVHTPQWLSKALLKSSKMRSVCSFKSMLLAKSLTVRMS